MISIGVFTVLFWLAYRGLGISRIHWWNLSRTKFLRQKINDHKTGKEERSTYRITLEHCDELTKKWILSESDFEVPSKAIQLVQSIASVWRPESSAPILEVRLGELLESVCEMNRRLERLTRLRGIRLAFRFRIRQVLFLARAWEKKRSVEAFPLIRFLRFTHLDFILKWVYMAVRFFDLSFWMIRMAGYLVQDVWLKVFLIHFYLTIGELAQSLYRKKPGESDSEPLLDEVEETPHAENINDSEWPEDLQVLVSKSRYEILLNTGPTEWSRVYEVYMRLIRSIAAYYYPDSKEPIYEAQLFSLLTGAIRLTESAAKMKTIPVIQKIFDVKLIYLVKLKETANWLAESQVIDWINERGLQKVASYTSILFKLVKRRHPAVLFKEFAWVLTKEGLKRWILSYAHQKIAYETKLIYSFEPKVSEKVLPTVHADITHR